MLNQGTINGASMYTVTSLRPEIKIILPTRQLQPLKTVYVFYNNCMFKFIGSVAIPCM
jgi:hypothetical protein